MKINHIIPLAVFVLALGTLGSAAQTVVAGTETSGSTLPGQGGTDDPDYTFLGPYTPGGTNGAQELTDFTLTQHNYNSDPLPTINAPAGSIDADGNPITTVTGESVIQGEQFGSLVPLDLLDFTVKPGAGSAYTLSTFFGIVDNGTSTTSGNQAPGEFIDAAFTVTLDNAAGTSLASDTLAVTDNNTSSTTGLFGNFALTGLVAGDVIHIIVTPGMSANNVQVAYIGGAGFTPLAVPEPSTYAMVLAGMGALVFFARRKLA